MKHLYTSGADHLTFEGGGGGMVDFRENILQTAGLFWQENTWAVKKKPYTDFEQEKLLPRSFRANVLKFVWHLNVQFVIQNI